MFKFLLIDSNRGVHEQFDTTEELFKYLNDYDQEGEYLADGYITVFGAKYDPETNKFGLEVVDIKRKITYVIPAGFI